MSRLITTVALCLLISATGLRSQEAVDAAALKTTLAAAADASADASDAVKALIKDKLIPLCTNEVFVAEATAQNAKAVSLDDIKAADKAWSDAEEELPAQKEKLSNACALEVKKVLAGIPAVVEAFVMDNQGANVGQNALTSDYWQGDEDKWQKSFNGGKGGIDVGKVKFDKSANTNIQQVSLPVIAADGTVVGAVTFGINTDKL